MIKACDLQDIELLSLSEIKYDLQDELSNIKDGSFRLTDFKWEITDHYLNLQLKDRDFFLEWLEDDLGFEVYFVNDDKISDGVFIKW